MAAIIDCSAALALDSVLPSKKDKLRVAFAQLEDHRAALTCCMLQWREVEEYLAEAERDLQKRHDELCEKEKAFESRVKEAEEMLDRREESIAIKEQLMQGVQALAVSVCNTGGEASEDVSKPEQDTASNLSDIYEVKIGQENPSLPNAAFFTDSVQDLAAGDNGEEVVSEVSGLLEECSISKNSIKECDKACSVKEQLLSKEASSSSRKASDPKLHLHLKELCEKMDGPGLLKYMVERRKDVNGLRSELPLVLQSAVEPAVLVLDSLDGYCFGQQQDSSSQGERRDSRISANRRACILLLECFGHMLHQQSPGLVIISPVIQDRAKALAAFWQSKMDLEGEALSNNSLDAQAFLQLIGTFGIASKYKKSELCKLVSAVARRRQTPALCRSLGLTEKIPEIVEQLASDGKQVEAISLAHEFKIMDQIQPVPLLKAYLKEAKKSAQTLLKSGSTSPAALNDSTTKELNALKNALKCIEEFDLESQFPSSPIQKRVLQLEKTKMDRKRVAVAVKAQAKRPRATMGTSLSHMPPERTFYRPQYCSMGVSSYPVAMHNNFDRRNQGGYGTAYGTSSHTPVALPAPYLYAPDGLPPPVYGTAAYAGSSPNYGNFQFGSGLPPPGSVYPAPFLH